MSVVQTGDIVRIVEQGNVHDGALCVYIGPWQDLHFVNHLTTSRKGDKLWYRQGQETGWYFDQLRETGKKASWCANCEQWFAGEGYLCQDCE